MPIDHPSPTFGMVEAAPAGYSLQAATREGQERDAISGMSSKIAPKKYFTYFVHYTT